MHQSNIAPAHDENAFAAFDIPVADNSPYAPSGSAFSIDAATLPIEGGTDPIFGTVQWRTLINGTAESAKEFVLGIAEFAAHGTLLPHRHSPAEFYLGVDGDGVVTIDGIAHRIAAGIALYIPGNAEHGVVAGPNGLRFTYGFAESQFDSIEYRFSGGV
jgi:quercetin dioxygenase-like cupin family protein